MPRLPKTAKLMLLISDTMLSLMWQHWTLIFTNQLSLSVGQVTLSAGFCELISVVCQFLALGAT